MRTNISKGAQSKQQIADCLNIKIGNLPVLYLGVPLSNNMLKARDFGYLIDKINKKINHKSSKLLNISGRVELIKTVILPMIQFWLQLSQLPMVVKHKINSICANFIWKFKAHNMS